jgi:hypothetical protein
MKQLILILMFAVSTFSVHAQELNARVSVVANRVGNNVNRSTFQTLQAALNNFLNNRKWTSETYTVQERIGCNFLLNLESTDELNLYKASVTIQCARPVFNSTYLSPLINFKDDNIAFKYQEFQQLEFNDNRVTGNDPALSNLTAVFAYYAYMIIGFDAASFTKNGGDKYFQKAQNIVNNAPDGGLISGWRAFDGIRNRYWLAENVINSRYAAMQDIYYDYYRTAMDKLYQDEKAARASMLEVLMQLDNFVSENPNKMITQFFLQGKASELINLFSKGTPQEKSKAVEVLSRIDISNANRYKDELK